MKTLIFVALLACMVVAEDDKGMAVKFLSQYHYLSSSRSGNHNMKKALENFQAFTGLPVTGDLDPATIEQMKKPRCGVADVDESGSRIKRFKTGSKWQKKRLTYFVSHGQDLPKSTQDRVFNRALKYWADESGLSFLRARNAKSADIKISFGAGTHHGTRGERTCGYPFDGPGKVLAHAFFPQDGRAHFDEDEEFTDGTENGINLLWVATHEFGHSLGLHHTDVQDAVMFPYYRGNTKLALHDDDKNGIRSLYGNSGGSGGVCSDNDASCSGWTKYCGQSGYVTQNCLKTCGKCTEE